MTNRILVFIISFAVWCGLVWVHREVPPGWDLQSIWLGILVSAIVAVIFGKNFTERPERFFNPVRWFYAIIFIPVFTFQCVKANLQVSAFVLNPKMPIKPGIVKIQTQLRSRTALTLLANCITLTPGTLTVEATPDGVLYVHWIEVLTVDEAEASRIIAGQFEWFLAKIFED